jgi:SpoIID/LytB domain protein
MSALNYPYKQTFRQGFKLIKILCLIIGVIFVLRFSAQAEDCDKISDLDDRATCYEKEKEKKEAEYSSITKKIAEIREKKDEISGKITELASQISITQAEIDSLQTEITSLDNAINELNENLKDRKGNLAEKEKLRDTAIRAWSKKSSVSTLERFMEGIGTMEGNFGMNGFEYLTFNYLFDKAVNEDSLNWIKTLTEEIAGFEKDKQDALDLKTEIAQEQENLLNVRTLLASQRSEAEEVKGALDEEHETKTEKLLSLEEEIAKLSEKQQEVLRMKSGDGSISGYEAPSYKLPDPPFKPAFAAMSYGAYTHYKGMSQYGAKGRAQDGQDYEEILRFYYEEDVKEKDDFPKKVCVEGYGDMDFQKYLYGLAEMPSDWPEDALKAQAVAGRSYAYRYVKSGKCICTSEACQVFNKSKSDNPPSTWKNAVDDTKNEILDGDVVAYYSSTTGGYVEPAGWDLDGKSWPGDAYEKKANSPWFYKAWYTQSYNSNSSTCGRSTPWLKEEEMADILNAWVVWRKGSDSDKRKVTPITTSCWGGDPYSMKEMAEKADKYGDKYTSISGISKPSFNSGRTTKICFSTNQGEVCIDGEEFRTVFNLRAPGYVALKSRLFDIEFEK